MLLAASASAPVHGLARPGSSSDHIPKLAYRSSGASQAPTSCNFDKRLDGTSIENTATVISSEKAISRSSESSNNTGNRGLSPSSSQIHHSGRSSCSSTSTSVAKKKSGFLTGIFMVQEPSMVALAHMESQMKQQKPSKSGGRVNPVGMPGVSSAKLPATVPKVNTKWDGVPDVMKQKDKESEKERRWSRSSRSESSSIRSHSAGPANKQLHLTRLGSHSTFNSFESHNLDANSENVSLDSSGNQTTETRKGRKVSPRRPCWDSFSGASLPDITILLPPGEAPPPPSIPDEFHAESLSIKPIPRSHPSPTPEPPTELPAHTDSPLPTPTDSEPETPHSATYPTSSTYIEPNAFHFPWQDEQSPPPPIPQRNTARLHTPPPEPTTSSILLRPSRTFGLIAEEARSSSAHSSLDDDLPDPALLSPIPEIRFSDDEDPDDSYVTETNIDLHRHESSRERLGLMATMKKDVERPPWDDPMYMEEEEEQDRPKLRFSFLSRGKN